ncbi:MAG: helix-turn-helix transcriptional regulator [bacterium]|nr:helix-turn-helix transcriptional regulator [bacterium]
MGRARTTKEQQRRAKELADSLSRRRDSTALTLEGLANESNIRYTTVCSLLAGKSAGPSFFLIADLAEALGASLDELAEETR